MAVKPKGQAALLIPPRPDEWPIDRLDLHAFMDAEMLALIDAFVDAAVRMSTVDFRNRHGQFRRYGLDVTKAPLVTAGDVRTRLAFGLGVKMSRDRVIKHLDELACAVVLGENGQPVEYLEPGGALAWAIRTASGVRMWEPGPLLMELYVARREGEEQSEVQESTDAHVLTAVPTHGTAEAIREWWGLGAAPVAFSLLRLEEHGLIRRERKDMPMTDAVWALTDDGKAAADKALATAMAFDYSDAAVEEIAEVIAVWMTAVVMLAEAGEPEPRDALRSAFEDAFKRLGITVTIDDDGFATVGPSLRRA